MREQLPDRPPGESSAPALSLKAASAPEPRRRGPQTLALLSGKGGSGKTVMGLSMARILAEAGPRVLLLDCDTSTHGASYFFEPELDQHATKVLSVLQMVSDGPNAQGVHDLLPIRTRAGFAFIPSTCDFTAIDEQSRPVSYQDEVNFKTAYERLAEGFDAVIFDCQAGYSTITRWVCALAEYKLVVMEPDAVSSSAVRALSLQLGSLLQPYRTSQIFNKITEDERVVYEKISGGTLFPNLPPIPFDWQVRAAFGVREIPGVLSGTSAFGLGVIRIMKALFLRSADQLDQLEQQTVGDWYAQTNAKLAELEAEAKKLKLESGERRREARLRQSRLLATLLAAAGLLISALGLAVNVGLFRSTSSDLGLPGTVFVVWLGLVIVALSYYIFVFRVRRDVDADREQERAEAAVDTVMREMERFRTLISSQPQLREYERRQQSARGAAEQPPSARHPAGD